MRRAARCRGCATSAGCSAARSRSTSSSSTASCGAQSTGRAHASWSKDQPIAGRSALSGVLTPSCNAEGHDGNNATAGCLLRGHEPSTLTLTLVPTLYDNSINNTSARGFRLQYLSSDAGGRAAPTAISATSGSLRLNVLLKPVATEYAISVAQPQLFVEFISRLISLGAGLAFFCRFMLWLYLSTLHARAVRLTHESREAVRAVRAAIARATTTAASPMG